MKPLFKIYLCLFASLCFIAACDAGGAREPGEELSCAVRRGRGEGRAGAGTAGGAEMAGRNAPAD